MPGIVKKLIVAAIGIEVLYLVAANTLLVTPIGPALVNMNPDRLQVQWDQGWSVVPGHIYAKGVKLRAQTRRVQWYLEVDAGDFWVRWWKLPSRRFEASAVNGRDVSLRLRLRLPEGADASPAAAPEIPGLTNPPQVSREESNPRDDRPWHVVLEDVTAEDLRQVWIQQLRITGRGKATVGGYSVVTHGGENSLAAAQLEFNGATVQIGPETLSQDFQFHVEAELAPLVLDGASSSQVSQNLSGSLLMQGQIEDLDVINRLYERLPIQISSESNLDINASLKFERGKLAPDSRILVDAEQLVTHYLHYVVKGKGIISGEVSAGTPNPLTTLKTHFEQFTMADSLDDPFLEGRGFELLTKVHGIGLDGTRQGLSVVATLPESFVPDLSDFSHYIPEAIGLKIEQGTGRMESQFEFTDEDASVAGEIKLAVADFVARYRSIAVGGHLELHSILKKSSLTQKLFDAEGTRVHLNDISVTDHGENVASGWWSKVTLGKTKVDLGPTPTVRGSTNVQMSDTRPVLAAFGEESLLPNWITRGLTLEDVVATSEIDLSDEIVELRDFTLDSDKLTVLGDLIMASQGRQGLLYIGHSGLGLAIERNGDDHEVKMIDARRWFNEKRAQFRAAH